MRGREEGGKSEMNGRGKRERERGEKSERERWRDPNY